MKIKELVKLLNLCPPKSHFSVDGNDIGSVTTCSYYLWHSHLVMVARPELGLFGCAPDYRQVYVKELIERLNFSLDVAFENTTGIDRRMDESSMILVSHDFNCVASRVGSVIIETDVDSGLQKVDIRTINENEV